MSPHPALPDDPFVDDVPWVRRVARPQVLTLGAIALAVLAPIFVALALAA